MVVARVMMMMRVMMIIIMMAIRVVINAKVLDSHPHLVLDFGVQLEKRQGAGKCLLLLFLWFGMCFICGCGFVCGCDCGY